jgi:hypothetical protein
LNLRISLYFFLAAILLTLKRLHFYLSDFGHSWAWIRISRYLTRRRRHWHFLITALSLDIESYEILGAWSDAVDVLRWKNVWEAISSSLFDCLQSLWLSVSLFFVWFFLLNTGLWLWAQFTGGPVLH